MKKNSPTTKKKKCMKIEKHYLNQLGKYFNGKYFFFVCQGETWCMFLQKQENLKTFAGRRTTSL